MYFGHTEYIEDCLDRGIVHLAGISRNVTYLGLPDHTIGKFLRRWERTWRKRHLPPSPPYEEDFSDDDDGSGSLYSSGDEMDVDTDTDEEEERRGRPATSRHFSR